MKRYHIKDNGSPAICGAKPGNCPLNTGNGVSPRFHSEEEASHFFETTMKARLFPASPDRKSAVIGYHYGILSTIKGHMRNSDDGLEALDHYYYRSPVGQRELEEDVEWGRKFTPESNYAQEIFETVEESKKEKEYKDFSQIYNSSEVDEAIIQGQKIIESRTDDDLIRFLEREEEVDGDKRSKNELITRLALVKASSDWAKNLSTEEQFRISTLTGFSFTELQYSLGYSTEDGFESMIVEKNVGDLDFENYSDMEDLARAKTSIVRETVLEAFKKAPEFENPVMRYRGTSFEEVKDILGSDNGDDDQALVEKIKNNSLVGTYVSEDARMSKIPASASVFPSVGEGFSKSGEDLKNPRVIFAVSSRSMVSPVAQGKWGSEEGELFINPLKKYVIKRTELVAKDNSNNRVNQDIAVVFLDEIVE